MISIQRTYTAADFGSFQGFPDTRPHADDARDTGGCSVDMVVKAHVSRVVHSDNEVVHVWNFQDPIPDLYFPLF